MSSQNLELARRIGELVSHFSEEWEEYQDWLRDIISSRLVLRERYPAWQTVVIVRWRLLYFVAYVGTVMVVNRLLKKLKSFLLEKDFLNFSILSERVATVIQLLGIPRYRYILQRTATLSAVVELTLCGIAAFTGILLAFYYQPTALGAYKSLTMIIEEVTNGSLMLSLHNLGGHSLIVLTLIQIVVMFLGRRFLLSWLTAWISGICLTLAAIGLSWTAIVSVTESLIAKKNNLTPEETALFRLLVKLIEDYEEQVYNLDDWSNLAPHEILQHLLGSSGTKQADLVNVISPSKGLISSIVNDKRDLSKEQAKRLGAYFKVSPSLFL